MGVDHRRRHIVVPEQLLDSTDIRTPLQQMGGKRVPARVGADVLRQPKRGVPRP